jgi:2-phospho-L-lactate/phosphoenolpyruvate guanylyltransferase
MQATVHRFDAGTSAGSLLLDDGTELAFDARAFETSGLRLLRLGQRLTIEVDGEGAEQRAVGLRLNGI